MGGPSIERSARRIVLIDTDTASDDAVALIMALRSPLIHVSAITVVAGNVNVEQATRNAQFTVKLCDSSVPVYSGAPGPLSRPLEIADWFHGIDGLGDQGFASEIVAHNDHMHAVDAMIATALANPGLEVITLGPLTNLAIAVKREPRIVGCISRCVVMGGAPCCEGNVTPAAEFNMWVDPDAARIVFRSGMPIELVGWQLSRFDAILSVQEMQAILALDNPVANFAIHSNSTAAQAYKNQTGEDGMALPDPIAMALLIDPELGVKSSQHRIEIETSSELTRGMTVVDRLNVAADGRNRSVWDNSSGVVKVYWEIDIEGWKSLLFRSLTVVR